MGKLKSIARLALIAAVVVGFGLVYVNFYSYLFSRTVTGKVEGVEKVRYDVAVMATGRIDPQMNSYSVAIREQSGEIVTASSEDRQWAVVEKGKCAVATFYPYPPWKLMKGGTYFNARLDKLYDCP